MPDRERLEHSARLDHGVIVGATALAAGMTPRQIRRRVERGQWVTGPVPGVYLLAESADVPRSGLVAACRGLNGIPWSRSAVAWWGLGPHPRRPIVAAAVGRRASANVQLKRLHGADHLLLTTHHGLVCPTVGSAIASAAADTAVDRLHEAIDEAVRLRLATIENLTETLARFRSRGRAGSDAIGRVLDARSGETAVPLSVWGRRFADRLEGSGLPKPVLEYRVLDRTGALAAQVDAAYPAHRLAFELDSVAFHHNLDAFENDRLRDLRLTRLGWVTIRITWHQFTRAWPEVTEAIASAITPSPRLAPNFGVPAPHKRGA